MSLICFLNGSLAREALKDELGLDWNTFDNTSLSETQDSTGKNLTLPFYGPEITPRHNFTAPVSKGSIEFESGSNASLRVRALLEGQFLNMRLHSQWMEVKPERIRLTGGASKSHGIAQLVANIFQAPVERLEVTNSAALGASLIAAVAEGRNLTQLQRVFCLASVGSTIQPDLELESSYRNALGRFANLLSEFTSG